MITLADILWLEGEAERRLEANENAQRILEDLLETLKRAVELEEWK